MVRNLYRTNGCWFRPTLACRNSAGPGVVRRINTATVTSRGNDTARHAVATTRSSRRLATRVANARAPRIAAGSKEGAGARDSRNAVLPSRQDLPGRFADPCYLVVAHVREHRQRQHLARALLGDRQRAIGKLPVGGLLVTWDRVMDQSPYAHRREVLLNLGPAGHPHDGQVVDPSRPRHIADRADRARRERGAVPCGYRAAGLVPGVETRELRRQDRRLQGVEPAVGPGQIMPVMGAGGPA